MLFIASALAIPASLFYAIWADVVFGLKAFLTSVIATLFFFVLSLTLIKRSSDHYVN